MTKQAHDDPAKNPTPIKEKEVYGGSRTYGFFHRHQKLIIYTAGVFTLLTFSITGALTGTVERWFGGAGKYPEMDVPGVGRVVVSEEDAAVARGVKNVFVSQLPFVMPYIGFGENDSQFNEQLAALRALAVRTGIDASRNDVDVAIKAATDSFPEIPDAETLAATGGTRDVNLYREWVREAIRVASFVRLSVLGVGQTEREVLDQAIENNEQVSFEVAYFDGKGFKEGLEEALTDDILLEYLAGLDEVKSDVYRKPAQRVTIKVAMLEEGTFNHDEYADELDQEVGDAEVQDRYLQDRESRYKIEKEDKVPEEKEDEENAASNLDDPPDSTQTTGQTTGQEQKTEEEQTEETTTEQDPATQDPAPQYRELDDELRELIREQLYAEAVLAEWLGRLDQSVATHMLDVINAATGKEIALAQAREALSTAEADLLADSGDEDLEKLVEDAKVVVEEAEVVSKQAREAVDARRQEFDFEAAVVALANGRPGLRIINPDEMADADSLGDLPELGKWIDSHLPGQMSLRGEIYNGRVQRTEKGAFIFQVTDIEERQFKELADIKEQLEEEYLLEKVGEASKEKRESFEETLERLAREALVDEIAELEKEGADQVETEFSEWTTDLEEKIKTDEDALLGMDEGLIQYDRTAKRLADNKTELEGADEKRKDIEDGVDDQTQEKVDAKLVEVHKDVLAAAAEESGLDLETIGPFSRGLRTFPRFKFKYPNVVQAVFGDTTGVVSGMEIDDVTELTDDVATEVLFMARCKTVDPATSEAVTRRDWLALRNGAASQSFAGVRMSLAMRDSFTIEALEKAYGWVIPAGDTPDALETPVQGTGAEDKQDK